MAQKPVTLLRLGTIAADVVARAIMRGVFHAADIAGHQSYADPLGRSPARQWLKEPKGKVGIEPTDHVFDHLRRSQASG